MRRQVAWDCEGALAAALRQRCITGSFSAKTGRSPGTNGQHSVKDQYVANPDIKKAAISTSTLKGW